MPVCKGFERFRVEFGLTHVHKAFGNRSFESWQTPIYTTGLRSDTRFPRKFCGLLRKVARIKLEPWHIFVSQMLQEFHLAVCWVSADAESDKHAMCESVEGIQTLRCQPDRKNGRFSHSSFWTLLKKYEVIWEILPDHKDESIEESHTTAAHNAESISHVQTVIFKEAHQVWAGEY